jgi:hypothetical protein
MAPLETTEGGFILRASGLVRAQLAMRRGSEARSTGRTGISKAKRMQLSCDFVGSGSGSFTYVIESNRVYWVGVPQTQTSHTWTLENEAQRSTRS